MRQHAIPVLLPRGGQSAVPLVPLSQEPHNGGVSEAEIQELIHAHPECLPIAEIDPIFSNPIPICKELNTPAGQIDNFMVTASGLPVLVECKLWRNPEGRREVVGQILDYAKELSRWSSSDLQREVSRRLRRTDNSLLQLVRTVRSDVDEIHFNDALTANLRRGRFLLLIVGDGIREGVEAISEYLQLHAGLHFSLGLVELPVYLMPDGSRLVAPRVLARTTVVTRNVVALPDGYAVEDDAMETIPDPAYRNQAEEPYRFWTEFVQVLHLDDPEQAPPKPARLGYISLSMPAPTSWLNVYREMKRGEVGVFLSFWKNTVGERAVRSVADDWPIVRQELGGTAILTERDRRPCIIDSLNAGPLDDPEVRRKAFTWLAERVNTFVNVLRPRIRSAALNIGGR